MEAFYASITSTTRGYMKIYLQSSDNLLLEFFLVMDIHQS